MSFTAVDVQLDFLAWRDDQLIEISDQLEENFPVLLTALKDEVEQASSWELARATLALSSKAEELIKRWAADQLVVALSRAETELEQTILQLPDRLSIDGGTWDQVTNALPAFAGVGLIAASVAAIPTVISFATVGTGFLAFWSTAAISWPLFALGAAVIGVASYSGSETLKYAYDNARERLCDRVSKEAERQVFGLSQSPGARCILNDIQAAVIQAGQHRIERKAC